MRLEEEKRNEIEGRRPQHRLTRRKDARGNHGGHRVGSVVKAVDVVEHQRQGDDCDQRFHRTGCQEYSSTMPSRMLATSSQRSLAASRLSMMSRHFMTSMASYSPLKSWARPRR